MKILNKCNRSKLYTCSAGAAKATVAITNNNKYFIVDHLKSNTIRNHNFSLCKFHIYNIIRIIL